MDINQSAISQVWASVILFLPRFFIALLIFLLFCLFGSLLQKVVRRFGITRALAADITNILHQIVWVILLLLGALTALGTLGVDVGAMIAGLGLTGFAVGFALKDIVSNILSGFFILVYKPFGRSDTITVAGEKGVVTEINLRYTVLKSPGKTILVPNQNLFSTVVVVHTNEPEHAAEQGRPAASATK